MPGVVGNREYNLRRVVVTLNGVPVTGGADGDFIAIAPNANDYNKTTGSRGEIAVSRVNDESGTITVRVFQNATADIARIEAVIRAQKSLGLQEGTFARWEVKDLNSGEHLVMDQCWSETPPARNFGTDQQAREYVFGYAELQSLPL